MVRDFRARLMVSAGSIADVIDDHDSGDIERLLEQQRDQILVTAQASDELDALKSLLGYVDDYTGRLTSRNLSDSVVNAGSVPLRDNTQDRLQVLSELRTRAFGKSVLLVDKANRHRVYRIAQANEGHIAGDLIVLNRLAAVAGKLVSAQIGDLIDLPQVGTCKVLGISLLDRYPAGHQDNFRTMLYRDIDIQGSPAAIQNVKEALASWRGFIDEYLEASAELDEVFAPQAMPELDQRATASLGAQFYTNTTEAQEAIVRRPGRGLVIVHGVAGSGKTSVALGRTKALCDRRYESVDSDERDEFFAPESAVGFVLHSQLRDYLKETRDQLHISDMPVKDYDELRQDHLRQRVELLQIKLHRGSPGKYVRCQEAPCGAEGTMRLLDFADKMVASAYAARLRDWAETAEVPSFPNADAVQAAIAREVWGEARAQVLELANRIGQVEHGRKFVMEGLGAAIGRILEAPRERMKKGALWLSVPVEGKWVSAEKPNETLARLKAANYEFAEGENASALRQLHPHEEQVELLFKSRARLFGADDQNRALSERSRDEISSLLQAEKILAEKNGRLTPVRWHQFVIDQRLRDGRLWVREGSGGGKWLRAKVVAVYGNSEGGAIRRRMFDRLGSALIGSLRLPDLLRQALQATDPTRDQPAMLQTAIALLLGRLESNKLSDTDIDLFLALAHLISTGDAGSVRVFEPPQYFSTVFIDEVQDFSELQVFLMGAQADPRRHAVTVVGDFCQQLYTQTVSDLDACFPSASQEELKPVILAQNKRQEGVPALAAFTQWFRSSVLPQGMDETVCVEPKQVPEVLTVSSVDEADSTKVLEDLIGRVAPNHSVAVICPTEDQAQRLERDLHESIEAHFRKSTYSNDNRDLTRPFYVHFTTAKPTKGLEFDVVIAAHFDQFDLMDPLQANSAYVAISRPRQVLHVIGGPALKEGPLAPWLAG